MTMSIALGGSMPSLKSPWDSSVGREGEADEDN